MADPFDTLSSDPRHVSGGSYFWRILLCVLLLAFAVGAYFWEKYNGPGNNAVPEFQGSFNGYKACDRILTRSPADAPLVKNAVDKFGAPTVFTDGKLNAILRPCDLCHITADQLAGAPVDANSASGKQLLKNATYFNNVVASLYPPSCSSPSRKD